MSGKEPQFKSMDDWMASKFPTRPGFRWFKGEVRSDRAIARIKKQEAYDAAIAKKREKGLVR